MNVNPTFFHCLEKSDVSERSQIFLTKGGGAYQRELSNCLVWDRKDGINYFNFSIIKIVVNFHHLINKHTYLFILSADYVLIVYKQNATSLGNGSSFS